MKPKILIIGAKGYIGSYLFKKLSNKYKVFGISRSSIPKDNIFTFNYFPKKKISFDAIIHAAGINPKKFSKKNQQKVYQENKLINFKCLKLFKLINCEKIIFLSSFSVYRKQKYINEDTDLNLQNMYSRSKVEMEDNLLKLDKNIYILRLCSVLGIDSKNNWLSDIRNNIIKNKPITLINKENKFNNCLDIEDLYRSIKQILISKKKQVKKIYNLSSNKSIQIKNLAKIIYKNKTYQKKIKYIRNKKLTDFFNNSKRVQEDFKIKFNTTNNVFLKYFYGSIKTNIIIIGSKGYIGSYLKKNLSKKYKIFSITKVSDLKKKSFNKNTIIIFCAIKNRVKNFYNFNVNMLKKYLRIITKNQYSKFIYISTTHSHDQVYKKMHTERERILKKRINNISIVCPGKVFGEKIIKTNYGINSMMYNYLNDKKIMIYGDGKNICPHTHINDLLKFIETLILNKKLNDKFFVFKKSNLSFFNLAKIFKKNDKSVKIISTGQKLFYKINFSNLIKNFKFEISENKFIEKFVKNGKII